jgi:hypothetical protein
LVEQGYAAFSACSKMTFVLSGRTGEAFRNSETLEKIDADENHAKFGYVIA